MGNKATLRGAGRPRSPEADAAIFTATAELLAEVGYDGFSMECLAGRAGVGKPTIYRRFANKGELVLGVIRAMASDIPVPDSGRTRDDLVTLLAEGFASVEQNDTPGTQKVSPGVDMGRLVAGLVGALSRHPELAAAYRHGILAERKAAVLDVLARGQACGDLRPDADLEVVLDLLAGPFFYRLLVSGEPLDRRLAERIVDVVLNGVGISR